MMKEKIQEIKTKVRLVIKLALNDYRQRFAASSLGIVWGLIPSIMTVLIYWFVFTFGFKSGSSDDPYILWLLSGMVPWLFFAEALAGVTGCFCDYSYLVKKMVFNVELLPHVKAISSTFTHVFFMFIMLFIILAYGYVPSVINMLALAYYAICLYAFVIALGTITSTLNVFFRDTQNVVSVFLQFGVWIIPVLWKEDAFPESIISLFKLNPMFYIVRGYRASLLSNGWNANGVAYSVYFWAVTALILLLGDFFERRAKKHFADIL